MPKKMDSSELLRLIEQFQTERRYGEIAIRIRNGGITSVAVTSTFLTDAAPGSANPTTTGANHVNTNSL